MCGPVPLEKPMLVIYKNSEFQNYGIIELWQNDWVISLRCSSMICSVLSSQSSFPSTPSELAHPVFITKSYRNILMINLAVSDLLAALTMPLTAMDALWLHWPLSDESVSMCRWCRLQLVDLSLISRHSSCWSDWSRSCPVWVSTCPPSPSCASHLTGTGSSVNPLTVRYGIMVFL